MGWVLFHSEELKPKRDERASQDHTESKRQGRYLNKVSMIPVPFFLTAKAITFLTSNRIQIVIKILTQMKSIEFLSKEFGFEEKGTL